MKARLDDHARWRAKNPSMSLFDYAYAVLRDKGVAADAILAVAALVWPDFVEVDGMVLLAEQRSDARIAELRAEGRSAREIELWINLFCTDGLFVDLEAETEEHAEHLAEVLRRSWSAKLAADFPARPFYVRIVRDADVGDVCVVFTQEPPPGANG